MFRKFMNVLIITTVTIMLIVTVFLLIFLYRKEKDRREEGENLHQSLTPTESGLLQKETGSPKEETVVRMALYLQKEAKNSLLSGCYLLFYHRKEKRADFFYLDGNTILEVSKEVYLDLAASLPELPQISKLSHLNTFSKSKLGLKAGMYMLNDVVGADIRHFAYIPFKLSKDIFQENKAQTSIQKAFFQTMASEKLLIKEYKENNTDLSKEDFSELVRELSKLKEDKIRFKVLPFRKMNQGHRIEKEEAIRLMYSNEEE